jgi:hypothetical protein
MNIKQFFVDALASAIDLGVGTPEDVLRHVTPDVLAQHLPRPLWARLITACLGAPKVNATLIVETIGIPNLAEHIPTSIIWGCIADIASRALGKHVDEEKLAAAATASAFASRKTQPTTPPPAPGAVLSPPPDERPTATRPLNAAPVAIGPSIPAPSPTAAVNQPLADLITELEQDGAPEPRLANLRPRSPTAPRFRQSNTAPGRGPLGGARRPQAAATPAPQTAQGTGTIGRTPRRSGTELSEAETETAVENADWRGREIAVDDSQLVDWQSDNSTASSAITGDDDFSDLGRKR